MTDSAIRFNGSVDKLYLTTGLPSVNSFTLSGWGYSHSIRGSEYQYFACLEESTSLTLKWAAAGWNNGSTWDISTDLGDQTGTGPSTGVWYYWFFQAGGGNYTLGWKTPGGSWNITYIGRTLSWTPAWLVFGNDSYDEWCDISLARLRGWNVPLTTTELDAEMLSLTAVRTSNLIFDVGATSPTDIADVSGNNHNLTADGTLSTTIPGPPISTGGGDQSITVNDTGAGSDNVSIAASVSVSDSGSGVDSSSGGVVVVPIDYGQGTDAIAVNKGPYFVASSNSTGSTVTTSHAAAMPVGTQNGDIMLAVIVTEIANDTFTPPSGWTQLWSVSNAARTHTQAAYAKLASGESGSYTWTHTSAEGQVAIATYRNAVFPVQYNGQFTNASQVATPAPSLTTASRNSLSIYFGSNMYGTTWTPPSSPGTYTERVDARTSSSSGNLSLTIAEYFAPAAGTVCAPSGTALNADYNAGGQVILAPAAVYVSVDDTGTGSEGFSASVDNGGAQSITVSDSGIGTDAVSIPQKDLAVADTGAGIDAVSPKASLSVSEIGTLVDVVTKVTLSNACINGVLTVDPTNPRYFRNSTGIVLLSGFHHWNEFYDEGPTYPPTPLDYTTWLDYLDARGVNYHKLWLPETARQWSDIDHYFDPLPYARTGPGNAADGRLKFDLTQFNQAFFDRLRERAILAGNRGHYVVVKFFEGWQIDIHGYYYYPFDYHWFNSANNINSINGDPNANRNGEETRDLAQTAIIAYQQAYIHKVIDTLNDLDNILWEISNEDVSTSQVWQYHWIDDIHTYEAGKAKRHPVGMSSTFHAVGDSELYASNAEWIAGSAAFPDPASVDGTKVYLYDTDHVAGLTNNHAWVWRAFCRGYNPIYMDEYAGTLYGNDTRTDATYERIRNNLGAVLDYAARLDLAHMTPQNSLSDTGHCLAKTTGVVQIVAYQSYSGSLTINLTGLSGTFTVEWLRTNATIPISQSGGTVNGGASRVLIPPWAGEDVVVLLEQTSPITVADTGAGTDAIGSVSAKLGVSDSGTGNDNPGGTAAALGVVETGTLTDALASLAASLGISETSSISDVVTAIASLTVGDTGISIDALSQILCNILANETGTGVDAITQCAAAFSLADSGAITDAITNLLATLSVAESSTGTEALTAAVGLSVVDSGVGTDVQSVSVTLTIPDMGAGVDAITQMILVAVSESGAAVDALSNITVSFTVPDSGIGVDSHAVTVSLSVSELATGADLASILKDVIINIVEVGSGTDAVLPPGVAVSVFESAQGMDVPGISVSLAVGDLGSLSDLISVMTELLKTVMENGVGADSIGIAASLGVSEVGAGVEGFAASVGAQVGESGSAQDVAGVAASLEVADSGSSVDGSPVIGASVPVGESGTASDGAGYVQAQMSVGESGTGSDGPVVQVSLNVSDAGAGSDAIIQAILIAIAEIGSGSDVVGGVEVSLQVADLAQAVDVLGQLEAILAVLDSAAGIDAVVRFDSAVRIVKVLLSFLKRTIAFTFRKRELSFKFSLRPISIEMA